MRTRRCLSLRRWAGKDHCRSDCSHCRHRDVLEQLPASEAGYSWICILNGHNDERNLGEVSKKY